MNALVLIVWLLGWQSPQQPPSAPPPIVPPPAAGQPVGITAGPNDYVIGPQDGLKVTVFGEEELSRAVTVDNDGSFDYPLVGRINASGKTVRAVQDEIRQKLIAGGYLLNPTVNVEIGAYRSQTIYVQGAVRAQGAVSIAGNTSLMSAIAQAGFTQRSGSKITISHRPADGQPSPPVIVVDRKDLESGRAQNIRLSDGDTITVAEVERFYITGEVKAPGPFDYDPELTIQQALILAGGTTDKARVSGIRIDRTVDGKPVSVKDVKITDHFQPNDTIIVPRKFF